MALSLQLGFPDVPSSITNPNVYSKNALDVGSPMSFLTFIKIINVSFEPDSLQNYYNFYLKTWNNQSKATPNDESNLIVTKYKEFLKDVTLEYTTLEEKRFLSKIDFNDPTDLMIAVKFYSKKLKELALHHNQKRHDIKYNIVRNKLKGTNLGIGKTIIELTLSYLKNLQDGKILYDYDEIQSSIEIELEELYDTYPTYFNVSPDPLIYDAKDLDYGYDVFLHTNTELISSIFAGVSDDILELKEVDDLFDNKRKLTTKYISTDFYYLSTGSTVHEFLSGKLFEATNPAANFLNRDYPTTVSTQKTEYLQSARQRGFFKPSNTSIVLVDGENTAFSFNFDNLKPNTLYYFPDPNIIGTNGDVLTFIVDDNFLKRNFSSGNAVNQPYSSPTDTKYNGYVSKTEPSVHKYLDTIFEQGFIKDAKRDVYNNLYGLFNDDFRFKKTVQNLDVDPILNILVDGYKFYDDLYDEGLSFNYDTVDTTTYQETIRSGLSTNTGGFLSNIPDVTLFFGYFTPYIDIVAPTETILLPSYEILECGFFTKYDGTLYDDPISSDLSAFDSTTLPFYYTDLIEGGVYSTALSQRALLDPLHPRPASFLQTPRGVGFEDIDGGELYQEFKSDISFLTGDYSFDNSTFNTTTYVLSSPNLTNYPNWMTSGHLLVRNATSREVLPILTAIPHLQSSYSNMITSELSANVIDFEISNDSIIIETPHYLILNKIQFEDGIFTNPGVLNSYVSHSTTNFDKISNRFKKDQFVYYYILQRGPDSDYSNDFILYPKIYRFDLINSTNEVIFPLSDNDITTYFSIMGGNVRYISADTPKITHNSRNNIFNISYIVKDQNNMFAIHEYDFEINPNVVFLTHDKVNPTLDITSNAFDSQYLSNLHTFLSAGDATITNEELIW